MYNEMIPQGITPCVSRFFLLGPRSTYQGRARRPSTTAQPGRDRPEWRPSCLPTRLLVAIVFAQGCIARLLGHGSCATRTACFLGWNHQGLSFHY